MMRKPPKYTQGFVDRHGKSRWYLRKRGLPRTPLPGLPWSPEFMTAYEAAMSGQAEKPLRSQPGTVNALAESYYQSADYIGLRDSTKATYRGIIERFRAEHGDKRVSKMEARHVRQIINDKAATPSAANNLLRVLRLMMRHAIELGWRRDNPTTGVRKIKVKSAGFATWTEAHIAAFLDYHGEGSRAYLALMLLLYTGQRRSDVVRMGRQHVRDGVLSITQQKTGTPIDVPVLGPLQAAIEATPRDNLNFLTTSQGKPFTPAGFTNWFRDCVVAVVDGEGNRLLSDGLSPHGLRKACARRLAEAGRSANEIMAVLGHAALSEAARYTAAADRKRLAAGGMEALIQKETGTKSVKPHP